MDMLTYMDTKEAKRDSEVWELKEYSKKTGGTVILNCDITFNCKEIKTNKLFYIDKIIQNQYGVISRIEFKEVKQCKEC